MKREFLVERNGRSFVLYAGLLDLGHERGLKGIATTLVQIPSELNGNMAICHATVETSQGTFTGLGDAAPENVSRMMVPHLIRMAETRAKARALRDAVNVGVTALEELGDLDEPGIQTGVPRTLRALTAEDVAGTEEKTPLELEVAHPAARPANGHANGQINGTSHGAASATPARPGATPATPKQLETIQRMSRAAGQTIPADGLTRAQASEIISSLIGEMEQRAS